MQDSTSLRSLIYYLVVITAARFRGRPVLLWGQGLGPLQRPISRALVRALLPLCSSASWRDAASLARARRWAPRLPMEVAPDPVWQIPARPWGVVRPSCCAGDRRPCSIRQDGAACSCLERPSRSGWMHRCAGSRFTSIKMHRCCRRCRSKGLCRLLARRSSTVVPTTLDSVFEQVRTARLVIPMRLHALVLARLAGCPMAALSYDPKVAAAAEMAAIPWVSLDQLPNAATLEQQWCSQADLAPSPERIATIRRRRAGMVSVCARPSLRSSGC